LIYAYTLRLDESGQNDGKKRLAFRNGTGMGGILAQPVLAEFDARHDWSKSGEVVMI
jgi:hypothetical protein